MEGYIEKLEQTINKLSQKTIRLHAPGLIEKALGDYLDLVRGGAHSSHPQIVEVYTSSDGGRAGIFTVVFKSEDRKFAHKLERTVRLGNPQVGFACWVVSREELTPAQITALRTKVIPSGKPLSLVS